MSNSTNTGFSGLSWANIAAKPKPAPEPAAPPVEHTITPNKSKKPSIAAKPRNTPTPKAKLNIKSNGSKLPVVAAKPKSTPIPQAKVYTEAEIKKALSTADAFDWADEMDEDEPAIPTPVRSLAALAPIRNKASVRFPVAPKEPQVEKVATPHFPTDSAPQDPLDSDAPRADPLTLRTWRRTSEFPTFGDAETQVAETPLVPAFLRPTQCEESPLAMQKAAYEQPLIVASAVIPEVSFQAAGPSGLGLTGLTHLFSIPLFSIAEEESLEPEALLDEASPIEPITLGEQETDIVKTPPPSEAQPLSIETGRGTEESQTVASVTPPESSVPSEVPLPLSPPETPSPVVVSKFRLRAEAPSFVPGGTEFIPSPAVICKFGLKAEALSFIPGGTEYIPSPAVSKFGFRAEAPSFVPETEYIPSPAIVSSEWCTHRPGYFQSQRLQREYLHAFLEQHDLIREAETRTARLALLGHYPGWGEEFYC